MSDIKNLNSGSFAKATQKSNIPANTKTTQKNNETAKTQTSTKQSRIAVKDTFQQSQELQTEAPPTSNDPSTEKKDGFFTKIVDFFKNLFGKEEEYIPGSGSVDDVEDPETVKRLEANPDFTKMLDKRHSQADPTAKAVYDKYEPEIKISDIDTKETARYSPSGGDITVNATEDLKNHPKDGDTYFHEIGHFIDDKMADGKGVYASDSEAFSSALRNDFNNYVNNYMEEHNITNREDAYEAISKKMSGFKGDDYKVVSDIYGGLSENKAKGTWGHDNEYWASNPKAVNHEAFANMFNAAMAGDKNMLKRTQEMLPTAYAEFQAMLEKAA